MEQTLDQMMKNLEKNRQRLNRTKQKIAKSQISINKMERRARVHRFCEIGGAIESNAILGRPLNDDDVSAIISFLADQEARGKFLSKWISGHTPTEKNDVEDTSKVNHE